MCVSFVFFFMFVYVFEYLILTQYYCNFSIEKQVICVASVWCIHNIICGAIFFSLLVFLKQLLVHAVCFWSLSEQRRLPVELSVGVLPSPSCVLPSFVVFSSGVSQSVCSCLLALHLSLHIESPKL